jgi:hypothetical protein
MPAGSREPFLEYWKSFNTSTNIAEIETVAKRSLSKHMTTGELTAFVRFMEDPSGRSAMGKMILYGRYHATNPEAGAGRSSGFSAEGRW